MARYCRKLVWVVNENTDTANTEPVLPVYPADGVHCRFCRESSETFGGNEYVAFWEKHEARSHKLEAVKAAVGHAPPDVIIAAVLDELL